MIALKKSVVLAVTAGLVVGVGYYLYQKQAAASPESRYKTQALAKGDVIQTVSANGTLNPVTLVSVGTQVSGTVKKLHVDFNHQVKAGQVLAELDDAIYSAQVRQSDGFSAVQGTSWFSGAIRCAYWPSPMTRPKSQSRWAMPAKNT